MKHTPERIDDSSRTDVMADFNAMVLAAGRGTRLVELGQERPKAMLPVCNQPLVSWVLGWLAHHGAGPVAVNLHHHPDSLRAYVGDGRPHGLQVVYSVEPELLGTGGGIKAMAALRPPQTTVVVNAKVISDVDLATVIAFHRRQRAVATLVLVAHRHAEAWGAVSLDHCQRVARVLDVHAPSIQASGPGFLFTGIHVIEPELVDAIPDGPCCVIRTAYAKLLARGAPIYGFVHSGYFYEHSTPERYLTGNLNLLDGRVDPPGRPGPSQGVSHEAIIDPDASLIDPVLIAPGAAVAGGAVVGPRVILGPGVTVRSGVALKDTVVWPGAVVARSVTSAVITAQSCLPVSLAGDPMAAPR